VRAAAVVLPVAVPLALPEEAVALLTDDPVDTEATPLEEPVPVAEVDVGETMAAVDVADVSEADDEATDVVAALDVGTAEVVVAADDTGEVVAADVATDAAVVAEPALLPAAVLPLLPHADSARIRTSDVR